MQNNSTNGQNKGSSAGAFLAGALVATIVSGYYLFGSKNAKRNRDSVEKWIDDARDEVLTQVKKVKKISKQKYDEIVDTVIDKYESMKEVGKEKAEKFRKEMKDHWNSIEKEASKIDTSEEIPEE